LKIIIKKLLSKLLNRLNLFLSTSKIGNYILDKLVKNSLERVLSLKHNEIKFKLSTPNAVCHWRSKTLATKEPETIKWIDNFKNSSIFWDVGANIGIYSVYAGKRGHKVFSFEPSFFNLETLSRNINLNNLSDNITVFPIALNDITKISKLNMSNNSWGSAHSTFDKEYMSSGKIMNTKFSYKTIGFSADDIAENLDIDQPNYIKIDVDGIEHLVLEGGKKIIKNAKSILIEVYKNFEEQNIKVQKILGESGFELIEEIYFEKNSSNQIWKKK
jgi:FkbM family methyltransferase